MSRRASRPFVVPVGVSAWQQHCCGEPFAIGDSISWWLGFVRAERCDLSELVIATLAAEVEPTADADRHLLRVGALSAEWLATELDDAPQIVRGVFWEDHHTLFDVERTDGIVRRIRLLSREYRQDGRMAIPIWGAVELGDVEGTRDCWRRPVPRRETTHWHLDGWLVDVEVTDTRPTPGTGRLG